MAGPAARRKGDWGLGHLGRRAQRSGASPSLVRFGDARGDQDRRRNPAEAGTRLVICMAWARSGNNVGDAPVPMAGRRATLA
jgi:hypothetical protein